MKRLFEETDRAIPDLLWNYFPQKKQQLIQIQNHERQIQSLLSSYKRKIFFSNCSHQEKILNKILRVYIRHQYIQSTSSSSSSAPADGIVSITPSIDGNNSNPSNRGGYFLLTIEGRLLDLLLNDYYAFGLFFDMIRIQVDSPKKYATTNSVASSSSSTSNPFNGTDLLIYEWRKEQFIAGKKANCFQFKIYSEKSLPIKIYFTRSDYGQRRYETSTALKDLFPNLRNDPTEEDVMAALWQYFEYHSCYDFTTTKPLIRCDEKLRAVLGGDSIPLSLVKGKIFESLQPCRPIAVDYTLLLDEQTPPLTEFSSKSIIKSGGRIFDLNVDVIDPASSALVADLNQMTSLELQMDPLLAEVERRADFIVTGLRHCNEEIEELNRVAACPIPSDLLSEHNSISMAAIGNSAHRTFVHPILGVPAGASGAEKSRIASGIPPPPPPPTSFSTAATASAASSSSTPSIQSYDQLNLTGSEFLSSITDPAKLVGGRDMSKNQMTQNLKLSFNGLRNQSVFIDVGNDNLFIPSLPWMQRHKEIAVGVDARRQREATMKRNLINYDDKDKEDNDEHQTSSSSLSIIVSLI